MLSYKGIMLLDNGGFAEASINKKNNDLLIQISALLALASFLISILAIVKSNIKP